jgi:hypothetical protein
MRQKIKHIIHFNILTVLVFFNCSYVVDKIESGITKRSSFSIQGSYNNGLVTISWDNNETGSNSEAFAGYEIYATEQPDNEFVGYTVIIASYDLGQDINERQFRNNLTTTISFDPDALNLNGVYFFRLGIIEWDKKTKEERAGTDDDDSLTTGWMPYDSFNYFQEYDESNFDELVNILFELKENSEFYKEMKSFCHDRKFEFSNKVVSKKFISLYLN